MMNKAELVAVVAERLSITKVDAERTLDGFLDVICETLGEGEKVVISGFGTFEVRDRVARVGRNPRTGEDINIPGQKSPAFKAGKGMKDAVK